MLRSIGIALPWLVLMTPLGCETRSKSVDESAAGFAVNAFPPTLPDDDDHRRSWTQDDCLLCHKNGINEAPVVKHEGMPELLLTAKCRSCHVTVDESADAVARK